MSASGVHLVPFCQPQRNPRQVSLSFYGSSQLFQHPSVPMAPPCTSHPSASPTSQPRGWALLPFSQLYLPCKWAILSICALLHSYATTLLLSHILKWSFPHFHFNFQFLPIANEVFKYCWIFLGSMLKTWGWCSSWTLVCAMVFFLCFSIGRLVPSDAIFKKCVLAGDLGSLE